MTKYLPLFKVVLLSNIGIFIVLCIFIRFDVKAPGIHGLSPKPKLWTTDELIFLFLSVHFLTTVFLIASSFFLTKSISDLHGRFCRKIYFTVINMEIIENYLLLNGFVQNEKIFEKGIDNKPTGTIKITNMDGTLLVRLDIGGFGNFQARNEFCEEVDRLRTECKHAIGAEKQLEYL